MTEKKTTKRRSFKDICIGMYVKFGIDKMKNLINHQDDNITEKEISEEESKS